MSSPRPPRGPPGPAPKAGAISPAGRPPPRGAVRGVGSLNSPGRPPAGRPPAGAPSPRLKAPPSAPPPRGLMQSIQRPDVSTIKGVDMPGSSRGPAPRGMPMGGPPRMGSPPPRGGGAPPRLGSPQALTEFEPDSPGNGAPSSSMKRPAVGQPKFSPMGRAPRPRPASVKQGAITRFEDPPPPVEEPAEKKLKTDAEGRQEALSAGPPGGKTPRPLVPKEKPPGLPEDVHLPPNQVDKDLKRKTGPSAPPPDRGRAPPKAEPEGEKKKVKIIVDDPEPPTDAPPYQRGKKEIVEEDIVVPRYERADPEFEDSDEDEEEADAPAAQAIPDDAGADDFGANAVAMLQKQARELAEAEKTVAVPATPIPGSGMVSQADTLESASLQKESEAQPNLPPVVASADHLTSAFAPAPPEELHPDFITSALAESLRGGRLSIRCIEGINIKRKSDPNKVPRLDPYLKFKLGAAEKLPSKTTVTKRKQDNNPKFDDEVVSFDVIDPKVFVMNDDVTLSIELYNKSTFKDELLGAVTMSTVRFFRKPFFAYEENVPIYLPGETTSSQKLHLEFVFEEARAGLFVFTLFEARGLRKVDPMGKQDPFVELSLGPKYVKKSKTIKDSSTDPYFGEEQVLLWTDGENWVNDLKVKLLDEELGPEKPIGMTNFGLLPYMNMMPDEGKEDTYDLFYEVLMDPRDERSKKEIAHGEVSMKIQYLPAGQFDVTCIAATNLSFPETFAAAPGDEQRMDPYVKMTLSGQAVDMIKRSPVDKDGGSEPTWDYKISFDLVDQYLFDVEVYHQAPSGGDDILLGFCQISLLSIFRSGSNTSWQVLKQRKANGGLKEMGNINLTLSFVGPANLAYPLHRPGIDSFDDSIRKRPDEEVDRDGDIVVKEVIDTVPVPEKKKSRFELEEEEAARTNKHEEDVALEFQEETKEFTEQEVKDAFAFIDLDHNNFVGASEIRHILVCMGEMITDEEVDMMIKMVDLDGDGQVSFNEFRTLVLHPNPGDVDMHKAVTRANETLQEKERQALTGKSVTGMDLSAFKRQKEMILRESKKKAFHTFVVDNETDFDAIKSSYYFYLEIPKPRRVGGRVNFDLFCQTLRIEPITEYKLLFNLFDTEEMGDVDMREVLLTLMNFVEVGREERLRFSFEMYDEVKTGYISRKEVEEILRGNHMLSSVQRKADTIMKQATTTETGTITLPEFIVVSKKFPNILLPGKSKEGSNGNGTGTSSGSRTGSRSASRSGSSN